MPFGFRLSFLGFSPVGMVSVGVSSGPAGPPAALPASKFWPVPKIRQIQDSDLWQEELGLHPQSPLWDGVTKMMIRPNKNIPGREWTAQMKNIHNSHALFSSILGISSDFALHNDTKCVNLVRKCNFWVFCLSEKQIFNKLSDPRGCILEIEFA